MIVGQGCFLLKTAKEQRQGFLGTHEEVWFRRTWQKVVRPWRRHTRLLLPDGVKADSDMPLPRCVGWPKRSPRAGGKHVHTFPPLLVKAPDPGSPVHEHSRRSPNSVDAARARPLPQPGRG